MDYIDDDDKYGNNSFSDEYPDNCGSSDDTAITGDDNKHENASNTAYRYTAAKFATEVSKYCGYFGVPINFNDKFARSIDDTDVRNTNTERYIKNVFHILGLNFTEDRSQKYHVKDLSLLLNEPFNFAEILSIIINDDLALKEAYEKTECAKDNTQIDNNHPDVSETSEEKATTIDEASTDTAISDKSSIDISAACSETAEDFESTPSDEDQVSENIEVNTPINITGIEHFPNNELIIIRDFHKHYRLRVENGDRLKTGYESIIHDIKQIGHNNMLRFIFDISNNSSGIKIPGLIEFFIFVVFSYTTPICFELFYLYFSHCKPSGYRENCNAFMPDYSEYIKPLLSDYIKTTNLIINDDRDYFELLVDSFCSSPGTIAFERNIDMLDEYRRIIKREGLKPVFDRFEDYCNIEKTRNEGFRKEIYEYLLIIHMMYLFDKPVIFLSRMQSVSIGYKKDHLDRIFFREELRHYRFSIEDNHPENINRYHFNNISIDDDYIDNSEQCVKIMST